MWASNIPVIPGGMRDGVMISNVISDIMVDSPVPLGSITSTASSGSLDGRTLGSGLAMLGVVGVSFAVIGDPVSVCLTSCQLCLAFIDFDVVCWSTCVVFGDKHIDTTWLCTVRSISYGPIWALAPSWGKSSGVCSGGCVLEKYFKEPFLIDFQVPKPALAAAICRFLGSILVKFPSWYRHLEDRHTRSHWH